MAPWQLSIITEMAKFILNYSTFIYKVHEQQKKPM